MKKVILSTLILFALSHQNTASAFKFVSPQSMQSQMSRLQPLQPLQPVGSYPQNYNNNYNNLNSQSYSTPYNTYSQNNNYSGINQNTAFQNNTYGSYPKISKIENILFRRSYENQDIHQRLNRIEQRMFRQTNQNMDLAQRVEIISSNIDPGLMHNIPVNNLSRIENKLFNRTFQNDDIESRIIRLEKEMLGAMQDGDLKERYNVVASAAKHYNAFPYVNNSQSYPGGYQTYNSASNTGVRGIIQNIMSVMSNGTLTGFTPSLNSYPYGYCPYNQNPYNSLGGNSYPTGSGYDNYVQSNRGYYHNNNQYGSGSSVRVLYD